MPGHTYRRASYNYLPTKLEFSDVQRDVLTNDDGSKEVPVTSVDLMLEGTNAFILRKPDCGRYYSKCGGTISGNLNKNKQWDTIVDELERSCISKMDRMNENHTQWETVYEVPIVGYNSFPAPRAEDDKIMGCYNELNPRDVFKESNLTKGQKKTIKCNPSQVYLDSCNFR